MKPPVPDASWSADIRALYQHDLQELWDPSVAPQVFCQYQNQLRLYLSLVPDAPTLDVLDVGCAQATLALLLAERGHRVVATDIRPQFLQYAASRYEFGEIRFVPGNVFELDFEERFHVIFCNQMLEHLVYPEALLTRLRSWLRPSARLVATTPNGRYVRNALPSFTEIGPPEEHAHRQFSADADGHFFAYLPGELMRLFRNAGFSTVRVRPFESPWMSGHMKVRHIQRFIAPATLESLDRYCLRIPSFGLRLAHQLLVEAA